MGTYVTIRFRTLLKGGKKANFESYDGDVIKQIKKSYTLGTF